MAYEDPARVIVFADATSQTTAYPAVSATANRIITAAVANCSDSTLWGSSSTATLSNDTSVYHSGGSSVKMVATTTGPFCYVSDPTKGVLVDPLTTFTLTAWVRPQTTYNFSLAAPFYTSTVAHISGGDVFGTATSCPANTWTQLTVTGTAPAGAKYMAPNVNSNSTMVVGDIVNVDDLFSTAPSVVLAPNGINLNGTVQTYAATVDSSQRVLGSTTAVTGAAGSSAGTSPPAPVVTGCTDAHGRVTFGTGSGTPTTTAAMVTITYGVAYASAPTVVCAPANAATAVKQPYITGQATTGFSIGFGVAAAASQANTVYACTYIVSA